MRTDDNPERVSRITRRALFTSLFRAGGAVIAGVTYSRLATNAADDRVAYRVDDKPVLLFEDIGVCDGVTDDSQALLAALSALASAGGGTLLLPPKTVLVTLKTGVPAFSIPANVRLQGVAGISEFVVKSDDPNADRIFVSMDGDDVVIDGLRLTRSADFPLIFVRVGAGKGFRLTRCRFDGRRDIFPARHCHGVSLDGRGHKSKVLLDRCSFTRLSYGLFQDNSTVNTVDNVVVDSCEFSGNSRDDLCFNAPNATMSNIAVQNSVFRDNSSTTKTGGFGVSFAHVTNGIVDNCEFANYFNEAIHVEDYSSHIEITSSTRIKSCGTGAGGAIVVITGSSDVYIAAYIDQRDNPNSLFAIALLAGGNSGLTPGGRPEVPPSRVVIGEATTLLCGNYYQGIYAEDIAGVAIRAGRIIGAGAVNGSLWTRGNEGGGIYINGEFRIFDTVRIQGFRYGIQGPKRRIAQRSEGNVVAANISNCYIGVLMPGVGPAPDVSGATIANCVHGVVGQD